VIIDRDGELLGSTGLEVETPWRAATGYVLARAAWGQGYGIEVASAMVDLAAGLGLARLYALCHTENRRSARVLERAGFAREGVLVRHSMFPNLDDERPQDVESWARTW
jgi:Acetyltransferases, including N-acetylases of ribosomal proteins